MSEKVKYYINGKQYIPAESLILCRADCGKDKEDNLGFARKEKTLYRTKKGAYFTTLTGCCDIKVELIDEKTAIEFMNENSACINTAAYDEIFGEPEKG